MRTATALAVDLCATDVTDTQPTILFATGSFWFLFIAIMPLCAVATANAFLMLTSRFADEKKMKKKKKALGLKKDK